MIRLFLSALVTCVSLANVASAQWSTFYGQPIYISPAEREINQQILDHYQELMRRDQERQRQAELREYQRRQAILEAQEQRYRDYMRAYHAKRERETSPAVDARHFITNPHVKNKTKPKKAVPKRNRFGNYSDEDLKKYPWLNDPVVGPNVLKNKGTK